MTTIFPERTIDRDKIRWEDYLYHLTPVEKHGDVHWKREDKFAPLGYHGVNGSKMRQCLWLVKQWHDQGFRGVISGSVVGSPQHPFISTITRHFKMGCLIVTGSKHYHKHTNMVLAQRMGAQFYVTNIGYARALESKCFKLQDKLPDHAVLETNITVDEKRNPPSRIEAFHRIGAEQSKNIPDNIKYMFIPAGSCNSIVSILYGIALFRPKSLEKVFVMGIGNNGSKDIGYVDRRLKMISQVIGQDVHSMFDWEGSNGIEMCHYDINGSGFCKYEDWLPFNHAGIALHPRYEGKVMNYIENRKEEFAPYWNDNTLFWIVGNEPKYV